MSLSSAVRVFWRSASRVQQLNKFRILKGCKNTSICNADSTVHQSTCRFYTTEVDPDNPRTVPDAEWEKRLTAEQYAVTRERKTEEPFSGNYLNHFEKGTYHCICCDVELFSSNAKFDSHCGWPSFTEAYGSVDGNELTSNILRRPDNSIGMVRTEVICKNFQHYSAGYR
ncbi:methionine-R-sulfoxide reductase B2, mitochondrial-like isoform X2 [Ostrea edulis]|uniref:methionine-R-sulfoxide reductase B2, mitochondrial-like isoform X2 n=1 Tax=Ostrea edulis TaxID=37623 RepID=UPI0020960099|nr:methionine-R-sulfoxide reductase B2, mitochondrial-like isoform X2 [Ostrea edulis]